MARKIIHVDLDAFFASVEQKEHPALRGKPVIICGFNGGRGVVSTASYEARKFGVRSALPAYRARNLCPHGYFIAPDFKKYKEYSNQIYDIFYEYTDLVEGAGIDEAYLDVSTNKKGISSAKWIAADIRFDIFKKTGLTASAGVGPNKLIAKIASDSNKPNGLTYVPPSEVLHFLKDLPIRRVPGIGPVTESRCWSYNIKKVGDFLKYDNDTLESWFGSSGPLYRLRALGIDDRPVVVERIRKSCGIEDTFANDISNTEKALPILEGLAKELEKRLYDNEVRGRTVTLKLKYSDFKLITRRKTLPFAICDAGSIFAIVKELLAQTELGIKAVRLLGISLSNLEQGNTDYPLIQPLLFD